MNSSHNYTDGLIAIGEVAKRLGVTPQTVRRWDKAGRLTALRTPAGHRRYRPADIEELLKASA